jgi:polysaccharide biosynthesis protein PslH
MIKIAYISHQLWRGEFNGGGRVSWANLELLRSLSGVDVRVFSIARETVDGTVHIPATKSRGYTGLANLSGFSALLTRGTNNALVQEIRDYGPTLVWFDTSLFGRTMLSLRKYLPRVRYVTFFHNIEFDVKLGRAWQENRLYFFAFVSDWINERISARRSDRLVMLHSTDALRLHQLYGRTADYLLPVTLPDSKRRTENRCTNRPRSSHLLFIGSHYWPNIEGICFFVNKVMPYLSDNLLIVGRGLECLRETLERPNVHVVGSVDDLSIYYQTARCVVAPIFSGGGMKVKIAEALMQGVPVVATPEALVGYEAILNTCCLRSAASADEFIRALSTPFESDASVCARNAFLKHYSMDSAHRYIQQIISGALKEEYP